MIYLSSYKTISIYSRVYIISRLCPAVCACFAWFIIYKSNCISNQWSVSLVKKHLLFISRVVQKWHCILFFLYTYSLHCSALEENKSLSWIVSNLTLMLMKNRHGSRMEASLAIQFHCSVMMLPFEQFCFGILLCYICQKHANIALWLGLGWRVFCYHFKDPFEYSTS